MKFTHAEKREFLKTNGYDTDFLWNILRENLDIKYWNWKALSANPNISLEILEENMENPDIKWDARFVSENPNITMEFIKNHPNFQWNWQSILRNPNITWKDIESNLDVRWEWNPISRNPNVNMKIVKENPKFPWNWNTLAINPSITTQDIKNNTNFDRGCLKYLPMNPSIDPQFIVDTINGREYNREDVNYMTELFSKNSSLDIDTVKRNLNLPWNWYEISKNPNITMENIRNNSHLRWRWDGIFQNPNITMDFVKENPDKHWFRDFLLQNPAITSKDITDEPRCLVSFLKNPNVDLNFMKTLDRKYWGRLSDNKFYYDDTVFNREYIKVKTKEIKIHTKNVLYKNTDVCPDIINEICGYVSL